MNIVLKIRNLANQKNMSFAELERTLNFSNGQIARWNRAVPGVDKVQKVADFFNVSVDFLLDRTPQTNEDEIEENMITLFRKQSKDLSDEEKEKFQKSLEELMTLALKLSKD